MDKPESNSEESKPVAELAAVSDEEEEPVPSIDLHLANPVQSSEFLSIDSTMPLPTISASGIPPVEPEKKMVDDSKRQSIDTSSSNMDETERMVRTNVEEREEYGEARNRIEPSRSISPEVSRSTSNPAHGKIVREDSQDGASRKYKNWRRRQKRKQARMRKEPPIINQPPVSLHSASYFQHQPVQYPRRRAQSHLMQPGAGASQAALPHMLAPYNSYPEHCPYYSISVPLYSPAYGSNMSWPTPQYGQSRSHQLLQYQSSIAESGSVQYGASSSQPSWPMPQYGQSHSQQPLQYQSSIAESGLQRYGASAYPSTPAPGFYPYNPANSTHLQGPMQQSEQPLILDQMSQTSVAFQNQDLVNVPQSRGGDETGRSERHGSNPNRR